MLELDMINMSAMLVWDNSKIDIDLIKKSAMMVYWLSRSNDLP